jgi:hypothetical protein
MKSHFMMQFIKCLMKLISAAKKIEYYFAFIIDLVALSLLIITWCQDFPVTSKIKLTRP